MKIAVAGKGGSGKTTIAGTLARVLARMGQSVLAIDGDSNPNLAITLGILKEKAAGLDPVPRNLLQDVVDENGKKTAKLTLTADEIAVKFGVDSPDGVKLLVMGRVDHAGAG